MKWDDVQVLLAIHRHKTLTAAGEALGMSHTTAWRRINALEKDLGQKLFVKGATTYELTEFGSVVMPHAQRIEDEFHAICRAATATDDSLTGTVLVTAPESMLPMMAEPSTLLEENYPELTLQFEFSDGFYDLGRRDADVAIRACAQPPGDSVGRRVATIGWAVYGPAGARLEDAKGSRWVGYSETLGHLPALRWFETWAQAPTPAMRVSSVPAMHQMLLSAPRFGLLPCFVGDQDDRIHRISPPLEGAESSLWVLVHPDLRHTARVRVVADAFFAYLRTRRGALEGVVLHDL